MPVSWNLLNQTVVRQRPVQTIISGIVYTGSYTTQNIQARVQEIKRRGTKAGESVVDAGLVTERHFVVDMNYTIAPNSNVATDITQTDRLLITDAGNQLECRITDLHDAAGARHHIIAFAVWTSPTGD
jgi:hypothetical protein